MIKRYAIYSNSDWTFTTIVTLIRESMGMDNNGFETEQEAEAMLLAIIKERSPKGNTKHYFILPFYIKK